MQRSLHSLHNNCGIIFAHALGDCIEGAVAVARAMQPSPCKFRLTVFLIGFLGNLISGAYENESFRMSQHDSDFYFN